MLLCTKVGPPTESGYIIWYSSADPPSGSVREGRIPARDSPHRSESSLDTFHNTLTLCAFYSPSYLKEQGSKMSSGGLKITPLVLLAASPSLMESLCRSAQDPSSVLISLHI